MMYQLLEISTVLKFICCHGNYGVIIHITRGKWRIALIQTKTKTIDHDSYPDIYTGWYPFLFD